MVALWSLRNHCLIRYPREPEIRKSPIDEVGYRVSRTNRWRLGDA